MTCYYSCVQEETLLCHLSIRVEQEHLGLSPQVEEPGLVELQ